ncbi:MAG: DUF6519 domain-containing protein [Actinomycetota bacterium]|nr:DUF6519 domain-containing protein [Actinomycetota bacterium]
MKGDFTRFTHDPVKHYSGVLQQQGRVSLDADWNEYVEIQDYIRRTSKKDIIGCYGVPHGTRNGFLVAREGEDSRLVLECGDVRPARIYVDGIMCEMEEKVGLPNPPGPGTYLVYLDVWQRHVTALEDGEIAEIALGGPDTTTRIKTEWRVRWKEISTDGEENAIDFDEFRRGDCGWSPEESARAGSMAAMVEPGAEVELCEEGERGGYSGLENRLYRVEIQDAGKLGEGVVTFKWSRDNGSVVFPVQQIDPDDGKSVTLRQTGKDDILTLRVGDWVEVCDDDDELNLGAGIMAQVAPGTDMSKARVVLDRDVSGYKGSSHVKIRRWDQKDNGDVDLLDGAIKIGVDWIKLEAGVQVRFEKGTYRVGDYWLIPARTRSRDILWDKDEKGPIFETRHGIEHHYCVLAAAKLTETGWEEPKDLRHVFPPLNERSCCMPVHPGEDIQEIIDCVVSKPAGGGCICLCKGVHSVSGPLRLDKAYNLTIRGENASTVVHFEGPNVAGEGGFVLSGCTDVAVTDMRVVGDGVPSLLTVKGGMQNQTNPGIKLENLTVLNRTVTAKNEAGGNCAIRLGNVRGLEIENCRVIGENGIIALFGDDLPDPGLLEDKEAVVNFRIRSKPEADGSRKATSAVLNYGIGVHKLRMRNSTVLYQDYGIWALKGVGWSLEGCLVERLPDMEKMWLESGDPEDPYRAALNYLGDAGLDRFEQYGGTAIKALFWKDCGVRNCELKGAAGMDVQLWLSSEVVDSSIKARDGLMALWLHDTAWRNNALECGRIGMALAGGFRSRIEDNDISGDSGLEIASPASWLGDLGGYLGEIVKAYNIRGKNAEVVDNRYQVMSLWVLLEEACNELGLAEMRDEIQGLLGGSSNRDSMPPILLLSGIGLYKWLDRIAELSDGIPIPLIALGIRGNEIEARNGVRLTEFIPLGGIDISDNRVMALRGQALMVKANAYAVDPLVNLSIWRAFLGMLLNAATNLPVAVLKSGSDEGLSSAQKEKIESIFNHIKELLTALGDMVEPVLEADYGIENNSMRSRYTAVETNLFGLTVRNNHIVMEESEHKNGEGAKIAGVLGEYDTTRNLGLVMKQRSKALMRLYPGEAERAATLKKIKNDLKEVSHRIGETTTDASLRKEATNLINAAKAKNASIAKIDKPLGMMVESLALYIDTFGIWIKGAGCRIMGNQVLAPQNADSTTWAQGGIRFWDDEGNPVWILKLLLDRLQDTKTPLAATMAGTSINDNEILRGAGHGVEIGGIAAMPEGMGLKIRGNRIQDMAGAGIAFDEKGLAFEVDIEGNNILDCGTSDIGDSLVDERGGVVIRNTAGCRIHENRIRCGSNQELKRCVYALDARMIYGLTVTDNYLQHDEASVYQPREANRSTKSLRETQTGLLELVLENLCGGVRLTETSGETIVQNNNITLSGGIGAGLILGNSDRGAETRKRAFQPFIDIGDRPDGEEAAVAIASVQANDFRFRSSGVNFAFLVYGVRELNLSGNNVHAGDSVNSQGYILDVGRGAINNNMLHEVIIGMSSGVIAGNVSTEEIAIPSNVIAGLNYPGQ